jgi:probable HAF family extracellular repeat protein
MTTYTYTDINFPGSFTTNAFGINNSGEVSGSYFCNCSQIHAFTYLNGTYTTVDYPSFSANNTAGQKLNNDGDLVGSFYYGDVAYGYFNGTESGWQGFANGVAYATIAFGVNDADLIVGSYINGGNHYSGFTKSADGGTYTTFDYPAPGSNGTYAYDINNSGVIIGAYVADSGYDGFEYDGTTWTTLDAPGYTQTTPEGINDAGDIVGYVVDAQQQFHGFEYSNGTYTITDVPGATYTEFFDINNSGQIVGVASNHGAFIATPLPLPPAEAPPDDTTANFVLSRNGEFGIWNVGNSSILAGGYHLDIDSSYSLEGLGNLGLMTRNQSGTFTISDMKQNVIIDSHVLGPVGLEWSAPMYGNFGGGANTDMILRNTGTGGMEVYDIKNNQITGAAFLGTVGLDWQSSGSGDGGIFLRNASTGGLEAYDIGNNAITGSAFLGTIGSEWKLSGVLNNGGDAELLLRNANTGGLQVYDIADNKITGSAFLGTVGNDWQFAGVAPTSKAGVDDLILRNSNTGEFEAYAISNDHITHSSLLGSIDPSWSINAAASSYPAVGGSGGSAVSDHVVNRMTQAMSTFSASGSSEGLLGAVAPQETSQQPLLTPPHA